MKASLRILGILLAVLFVMSLVGCSETADEEDTEADDIGVEVDEGATVVDIPDAGLRAAIAVELGIEGNTPITVSDMLELTYFNASDDLNVNNRGTNLTGLEYATNLTELYLDGNAIVDVSPLKNLTKLETLELEENPLSRESVEIHIPAIEANGTTVHHD